MSARSALVASGVATALLYGAMLRVIFSVPGQSPLATLDTEAGWTLASAPAHLLALGDDGRAAYAQVRCLRAL
jgi:hypothetical protein